MSAAISGPHIVLRRFRAGEAVTPHDMLTDHSPFELCTHATQEQALRWDALILSMQNRTESGTDSPPSVLVGEEEQPK